VYGPGDRPDAVLPFVIEELLAARIPELGPCLHDWDLLHVDDTAAALVALVDHRAVGVYNVASGERRPLRDAIDMVADAVDGPTRPAYGRDAGAGTTALRASIDHLVASTGWSPQISLFDGVHDTVEQARADLRESPGTFPPGATA